MTDSLSKTLGIEYKPEPAVTELVPVSEECTQISDKGDIPDSEDVKEDYRLARKTFKKLIDKGTKAIDSLESVSKLAEDARESSRVAEVMASLIKTVSDTTKDMFVLQKMVKDLKDAPTDKKQETTVNVDKAVFVGTTSELLKKIKAE